MSLPPDFVLGTLIGIFVLVILFALLLYVFARVITWGVMMSINNFRSRRWRRFIQQKER